MGLTQVETGGVKDNSITSGKILDSEIETSDIKDGAVTTAKLANGAEDGKVLTSNNGSAPTFNTPTVEGTNVKSTGETDTTKFLRVDGDGTSSWQTPQGAGLVDGDNDGLAPQLPNSHGGKFLKADATWEVPPYPSTVDIQANGLAPILPSANGVNVHGGKFLKADGTWEVPAYIANTDTTYSVFSEGTNGLAPATASGGGDSAKFLKGNATWAVPTVPDVTTNASGVVHQLPDTDETTKFLRGDNTWAVPPDTDTTYSLADTTLGGNGLVKQLPTDGGSADTTKYLRGDNTWVTPPFLRSDTDDIYEGGNLQIRTNSSSGQYWGFNLKYDSGWEYITTGGYGWAFRNGGTNGFEVRVADDAGTAGQTASLKNFFFKADGTFHIPNQLYTGAGTSAFGGNIQINTVYPMIVLNDTDSNSDFQIINSNGIFTINDSTNSADRFTIASDGVVDVAGNLDVGAGLDVTGDITLEDNGKIILGGGGESDSYISFDGSNLNIKETSTTGSLRLDGQNIFLRNPSQSNEDYIKCLGGSSDRKVELYQATTKRLETTSTGVNVTGNITTTGTLEAKAIRYGDSHVKRISVDYVGTNYLTGALTTDQNVDELQEILTITPANNYRNYTIIGRIFAQDGNKTHTVDLNMTLRVNAMPSLEIGGTYISTIGGSGSAEYITPRCWLLETGSTGSFKLVAEINKKIHGRVTADLEIITRYESDLDNVVVNEDETSEVTEIPSGYTSEDLTKIYETNSGAFTFNSDLTFNGDDYNVKWDKSEDYLKFDDDAMAVFGDSADLRIYHTGNESWIKDSGTGNLYIASSGLHVVNAANTKNVIRTIDDGAVQLFYNGTQYLATYDGGVSVTGDITVSGTVDGVDVAKLDALAYCNLNKTSLTEDINEEGIANKVAIRWDNKVYKSTTYTHSTDVNENPEKIQVGSAGLYMINVNIGHDNTSGGRVNPRASLWKNDTEITETRSSKYGRGAEIGDEKSMQINTVLQLASGDHLKVYAWSDFSANYNPAVNTVVGECEFVMTRLAGGVEAE